MQISYDDEDEDTNSIKTDKISISSGNFSPPVPLNQTNSSFANSLSKLSDSTSNSTFINLSPEISDSQKYSTGNTAQIVLLDDSEPNSEEIKLIEPENINSKKLIDLKNNLNQLNSLTSPTAFQPSYPGKNGQVTPKSNLPKHLQIPNNGIQSYALTPPKIAMAKADDSESENEEHEIPVWAQKEYLHIQVERQHKENPDPTKIFPIPNTCDLEEMFAVVGSGNLKKRSRPKNLRIRGSSGNWSKDGVTKAEEEHFRKKMRYR